MVRRRKRRFGLLRRRSRVAEDRPENLLPVSDTYWATDDDVLTGSVEIDLGRPCAFNVVEIQEYIPLGQRVKAWAVDAWMDTGWQELGSATTIGYKRLLRVPDTTTSKVRIRITSAKACPTINHVGLYQAPVVKKQVPLP